MAAVTVGTTATAIVAPSGSGRDVALYNAGSATVYLDVASSVSASAGAGQGLPLAQGAYITLTPGENQNVYGICASGSATVNTMAL